MLRKVEVRDTGARRSLQVERVEWRIFIVIVVTSVECIRADNLVVWYKARRNEGREKLL